MNSFVQYLDQFNVLSPSHSKIYDEYTGQGDVYQFSIDTKIEEFLLTGYSKAPCSVIMTGNAGDGKTRLCRVVYESLTGNKLSEWPDSGILDVPFDGGTVVIVKDLSELKDEVIFNVLLRLQEFIREGHAENRYFLIAANEGKLTKFLSMHSELEELAAMVKQRFLYHGHNDSQLHLVNLQDVTSSIYAERIMEEWNKEEYWSDCGSCGKASNCIILLNHRRMARKQVRDRLAEQYRLLDCLGIHLTMREILIHISYTLTGGLTCSDVQRAGYLDIEKHSKRVYFNNFYGVGMPGLESIEQGAVRHFGELDPGQASISFIDDYLLNGDISGENVIAERHARLFGEELDLLFGYYRKQIEVYRSQGNGGEEEIAELMPGFRRKYFFESEEEGELRRKLIPYVHFYTFMESLESRQKQTQVRRDLIRGLNYAFTKKLMDASETQLFAVNDNLLVHEAYSMGQVVLTVDESRDDLDRLPSRLFLTVDHETRLEMKLPVFEYLMRLADGGLNCTLKQEVDILLGTFRNDLISHSKLDEFLLVVFALDPVKGVYVRREINM
ncbi:hypothetical protein [Paenibacillus paeoniae]|uniref:Uncharacterized protein n=1 Tax=Paenibacillus paeoniae TaxID=2292705 RepID=A0A371PE69_9BACL|nr:hypothetical protein [Paenibacillus paeoniae]REK74204.1 hypothetical protein DX130_16805 [Paenibacillus paeoniae]